MLIVELSFILCIEVLFFVFLTFFRSSLKPSSIYFFVTKKKRDRSGKRKKLRGEQTFDKQKGFSFMTAITKMQLLI